MAKLPARLGKYKLTWKPDTPDARDFKWHPSMTVDQLPPAIDLTNRADWPEPYNQEELGSCVFNTTAGAIQYEQIKAGKKLRMPSRLFLYYMARVREGTVDIDNGAEVRTAVKVAFKTGACTEKSWPYLISRYTRKPGKRHMDMASRNRIPGYQRVDPVVSKIKMALAEDYPVLGGFYVYRGYFLKGTEKTGKVPIPLKGDECLGGHAVLIVGYDDRKQRFKFRNSYGPEWGDGGYGYLPYEFVIKGLADDFWILKTGDER